MFFFGRCARSLQKPDFNIKNAKPWQGGGGEGGRARWVHRPRAQKPVKAQRVDRTCAALPKGATRGAFVWVAQASKEPAWLAISRGDQIDKRRPPKTERWFEPCHERHCCKLSAQSRRARARTLAMPGARNTVSRARRNPRATMLRVGRQGTRSPALRRRAVSPLFARGGATYSHSLVATLVAEGALHPKRTPGVITRGACVMRGPVGSRAVGVGRVAGMPRAMRCARASHINRGRAVRSAACSLGCPSTRLSHLCSPAPLA